MSDTDSLLVERAQKGDQKAFEVLVRKYQGKLASVISRYVNERDRVQDLTQEAFIKAYRALGNFRGEAAFYTWLYRIGVNTAKNHLLASSRGVPSTDVDLDEAILEGSQPELQDNETPERKLLRNELMGVLRQAIDELSPSMRQVIELRELRNLSYEEIAVLIDCPIGTVRSRIFRARQELADRIRPYLQPG